jgi:hypothetical protein
VVLSSKTASWLPVNARVELGKCNCLQHQRRAARLSKGRGLTRQSS